MFGSMHPLRETRRRRPIPAAAGRPAALRSCRKLEHDYRKMNILKGGARTAPGPRPGRSGAFSPRPALCPSRERKSVVWGKSGYVLVEFGGRRNIKNKTKTYMYMQ